MIDATARLIGRRPEGRSGQVLTLAVPAAVSAAYARPGQYCTLELEDATGIFAIASPPGAERFEIYVQPGGGSADRLVALPIGQTARLIGPAGDGYALGPGGPVFVLATGSGLSGVRAIVTTALAAGRIVTIYAGFRTDADILFADDLAAWAAGGATVVPVLSRPGPDWTGLTGYVQHALADAKPDLRGAWVIVCGQGQMHAEAATLCERLGLRPERFLTNY